MIDSAECDRVVVLHGHFEVISRLQLKALANRAGQDDLALLRQNGGHGGKIFLLIQSGASRNETHLPDGILTNSVRLPDEVLTGWGLDLA